MTRDEAQSLFTAEALPKVRSLAIGFASKTGLPLNELIQVGALAAWQYLAKFDPAKGFKVATFIKAPVPRTQQRARRLVDQEGESAKHGSPDGEACRASRAGHAVLIAARRERSRPVWWQRVNADGRGANRPASVPDGD